MTTDQRLGLLSDWPDVAILMATYEGERFLAEQVKSIFAQTCGSWHLWVSDDSISLATSAELDRLSEGVRNRIFYSQGPRRGVVANFLDLACNPNIHARFYAFADQDDIWDSDKLERALAWLISVPSAVPAMYCTRTRLIDEVGRELGKSPLFSRRPTFRNALVQSLAGGNTMVFNHAARQLLVAAGKDVDVPVHDWWLYLLVTGCGGVVQYDPQPSLGYRQHTANLIGGNTGWRSRLRRLFNAASGAHESWFSRNIYALKVVCHFLTEDSRRRLVLFSESRKRWLIPRVVGVVKSGVCRQSLGGNISLFLLILIKRI